MEKAYFSHETAVIDEGSQIGEGVKIWHFSHVMPNSVIGDRCNIGQNVVISPHVILGNNVKVQNNVSIYTGVICEDDVFLGPSMVFTNIINPRSAVVRRDQYMETIVKKGASIGANATVICGNDIGRYALIGAGAVVTKGIPDFALVVGNPAKQIGWVSEYGHRLHFDENNEATCPESGDRYQLKDGKVSKASSLKILLITYYWPPGSSPGVQRWLKFVKYLVRKGITPTVLTVSNASVPFTDQSLLEDVPKSVEVMETKSYEPITLYNFLRGKKGNTVQVGMGELTETKGLVKKVAKYIRSNVFIPDAKVGWYYAVRKRVSRLVQEKQFDLIVTTGPPHTTHLIGLYVKERLGIKWIADLRDPWTGIFYEKFLSRTAASKRKNEALESQVLSTADQVIVVSEGMKRDFAAFEEKITVLPNGFDEEDIPNLENTPNKRFTLRYTGNLLTTQDISSMWEAIRHLKREEEISKADFVLEFVGNRNKEIHQKLIDLDIDDLVEYRDFVPHKEAVKLMQNADLLWLPIPQSANNLMIITGKIFEYLASKTPILSIGPVKGDASTILDSCRRDKMHPYEDEDGIRQQIKRYFTHWKEEGQSLKHDGEAHLIFSRNRLTDQLIQVFHQTTNTMVHV